MRDAYMALDRRLLPLMGRQHGVSWPTLLDAVTTQQNLPDAGLLQWLSDALHYQLVEQDPSRPGTWRLTAAGEQRVTELAPSSAQDALTSS